MNKRGAHILNSSILDYEKPKLQGSEQETELKKSASLDFLKDEEKKLENIFDNEFWSLYENNNPLKPIKFSNGKTQEDVVEEVVSLIKSGKKIIFLHGVCGTGKSAIALNIARSLGRASIVVPIKSLQRQYEEEYMGKKYLIKKNGKKMKIAMITGRENHDSIILPGTSCADPMLPDTIKIIEKNYSKLEEYYLQNPCIEDKSHIPSEKNMRRISIAPANPYWSPILPAAINLEQLKDAEKIKYKGVNGQDFVFYHRKPGCSYYDQYLSYTEADVIIFNSAKYLAEFSLGRKPATDVEIIDEGDEFLDSLSNQIEINLTRLNAALKSIIPENEKTEALIKKISNLIDLEEKNKKALGVDENKIFQLDETKLGEMLRLSLTSPEFEAEVEIDELNYSNTLLEAAKEFRESFAETYLTFRKDEDNLLANLVTTNLSRKFAELAENNKALILMSGTLHNQTVLEKVFGIEDFEIVEAEGLQQGSIEIVKTGKEFDCSYANLRKKTNARQEYLMALQNSVLKSKKPSLIHVNAFQDLPSEYEMAEFDIPSLMSREELKDLQLEDKTGKLISVFKSGLNDKLFTTKCSRGIDFPGNTCNSIIFTKYPNPNIADTFWKILQKTHPEYFWDFYKDKARREFLQRIYRALRSKSDHVYVLSPDTRVLESVRELQRNDSR